MWKIIAFLKWLQLYGLWKCLVPVEQDELISRAREMAAGPIEPGM